MGAMPCARLADVSQFLAQHPSKYSLQWLFFSFDIPRNAVSMKL
jgi:hypothetical protein